MPLLLSEVSLRVTLTHFTLLSYERAPCCPTSFHISGLARLGVKPRLYRSSWRALASTHPLMLPSTSPREASSYLPSLLLLGVCHPSPWSLPFFLHALTLIPLSLSKVQLSSTLTHSSLTIWYSGQMVPFLLARVAPAFFPTAFFVALGPRFPFQQAQFVQVFPLKPAPFCTLFAGLGNTTKSAISLLFSSKLTLVLSSQFFSLLRLSSYLKLCGRSGRNCFLSPPVLSSLNESPDTRFSRGMTRMMSWPDGEHYLRPPQPLVVSLLLSLVSTLVLPRTGGVLSHLHSLTHRFPRFPLRNLGSIVMLAMSSLVYAATDTAFFQVIFLGLAESKILPAAPVDTRPRTPLILFCTVQLRTLCAAYSLATLCLSTTSGPGPGELPGFWGSMVFCHAPIPQKGSNNQQQYINYSNGLLYQRD